MHEENLFSSRNPSLPCKLSGQHEAEAKIVVTIGRGVVVAIGNTTVRRIVVPATTTIDPVRSI